MQVLFSENVCENERIGSRRRACAGHAPHPRSANAINSVFTDLLFYLKISYHTLLGLCRTCEIFGVSEYVISSIKFVNDRNFETLSVSAHKWLPITEVPPQYQTFSKTFTCNQEFKLNEC